MSLETDSRVWAIIPAAGVGSRMGGDIPKQYLSLGNKPVILHTLERLAQVPSIERLVVGLSAEDQYWPEMLADVESVAGKTVEIYVGGKERADTVLNGLLAIEGKAKESDWVLVHDAARPCVRVSDIEQLLDKVRHDQVGGLLALPVADTVKRANDKTRSVETVPRDHLWRALTPQVFPYGALKSALQRALENSVPVTDEASAMEYAGSQPLLVTGHSDNIKITHPEDLKMAELFLSMQEKTS
ncbi:MAG: 2-C-methyl-D-erythritol 4-phosphate cytidylyltransferase [Proteobacteria bacterium]|nr:2-C-methyl-D-erythritol 4-phosphate cytidylyltransferase [Pseudomonadota bacterium]